MKPLQAFSLPPSKCCHGRGDVGRLSLIGSDIGADILGITKAEKKGCTCLGDGWRD